MRVDRLVDINPNAIAFVDIFTDDAFEGRRKRNAKRKDGGKRRGRKDRDANGMTDGGTRVRWV